MSSQNPVSCIHFSTWDASTALSGAVPTRTAVAPERATCGELTPLYWQYSFVVFYRLGGSSSSSATVRAKFRVSCSPALTTCSFPVSAPHPIHLLTQHVYYTLSNATPTPLLTLQPNDGPLLILYSSSHITCLKKWRNDVCYYICSLVVLFPSTRCMW